MTFPAPAFTEHLDTMTTVPSMKYRSLSNSTDMSNIDITTAVDFNITRNLSSDCWDVSDKKYDKHVRIITLYITLILGLVGGIMVLTWMWSNRRLKNRMNSLSRVNSFILNLSLADMLVMLFAVLPQLVWEYQIERAWVAGAFMCKLVKFVQSFTLMASTNMLVVIAIDRHQAITKPLQTPVAVWKMAGGAWLFSMMASLPMFYVFRFNVVDGIPKCESIFRDLPMSHRKAFLTYAAVIVFLIPILILIFCYIRIFLKIARKAKEGQVSKRQSMKPGKVHLQSTGSTSLTKAKIKTLKMTFVIVFVYLMCGIPYFIAEMILSYGDHCVMSKLTYALVGGLAAANSAGNPYVFLLFNCNGRYARDLKRGSSDGTGAPRTVYSTASTRSDYVADSKTIYLQSIKYKWNSQSQES